MPLTYKEVENRLQEVYGSSRAHLGAIYAMPRLQLFGRSWVIAHVDEDDFQNKPDTDISPIFVLGTGSDEEFQRQEYIEDLLVVMRMAFDLEWTNPTEKVEGHWKFSVKSTQR